MTGENHRDQWLLTEDGLKIHARLYGSDEARQTIVCLPGLTRNGRDFHQLALRLTSGDPSHRRVITIDSRGRGLSDRDMDKSRYTLPVETADALFVCDKLGIGRAAFIGTSRGGLILHLIAALKPDLLQAVILNDIGPVIEIEGLRHIQAYLTREKLPPRGWAEAVESQKTDHSAAFPSLTETDWTDLAQALYRDSGGHIEADYDPAIAEQMAAVDLSKPAGDLWPQFNAFGTIPIMVIRGENTTLLSKETVAEMTRRHPGLVSNEVPGQGHPPLLHKPEVADPIEQFLNHIG